MKPAIFLAVALVTTTAFAQIPKNVVSEFERIHPAARYVEWKTEWGLLEDLYKVTYTSWYRQVLVFNREGKILISESELPPDYIPNEIHAYMKQKYPHTKYVVWDSFDKNNNRSYFVISNRNEKLLFTNECEFVEGYALNKPKKQNVKKQNLLSFLSTNK
jgi:hypothetical protein